MSSARAGAPRWALSFADLCLLLLGFFVILHVQDSRNPGKVASGIRKAFAGKAETGPVVTEWQATRLFEPGEAVLRPIWRDTAAQLGRSAAKSGQRVRIMSEGTDPSTQRLDGWELSAARAAAIARTMRAAGVREDKIELVLPPLSGGKPTGQKIGIVVG